MPKVFTIFCHGTDWNRDKKEPEIVNFFAHNAQGSEYESWLMLDGVGSRNRSGQMAGQFDWASRERLKKRGRKFSEWLESLSVVSAVTGHGVSDNVRHAIVALANLEPMPTCINLIGWSRGAVTALIIANKVAEIFPDIKDINIFAIDPVAGRDAGIDPDKPENRTIPAAVKNYLAFLAMGENRRTFKPQDATRVIVQSPASNVVFLPIDGIHGSPALHDKATKEISQIAWSTAYLFLTHLGTPIQKTPPFFVRSDSGLLEAYSNMKLKDEVYKSIKQKGMIQFIIGRGFSSRDFAKNLDEYVINPEYFINQHHRQCFQACLPQTFKYLFTSKAQDADPDKILKELKQATAIATLESLKVLGVELGESGLTLPEAGYYDAGERAKKLIYHGSLHAMGILSANDSNR